MFHNLDDQYLLTLLTITSAFIVGNYVRSIDPPQILFLEAQGKCLVAATHWPSLPLSSLTFQH